MKADPQKEHDWLQKLVGDWTYESECNMGPDKPREKFTGKETVRSLGGVWTIAEGKGAMPDGGEATTIMTLGYDPQKKKYVGTWLGSMMTFFWIYEGSLDSTGKVLTLDTEGPDFSGEEGKTAKYQDIIEFKNDDHRTMRSQMLGADGTWQEIVVVDYRRSK